MSIGWTHGELNSELLIANEVVYRLPMGPELVIFYTTNSSYYRPLLALKQSRHNTSVPFGWNGTVSCLPHLEQVIGKSCLGPRFPPAPPPKLAFLLALRQSAHREGGFENPLSW